jgi:hypothetical protein
MTRKWEPREMKMVSEYLAKKYQKYQSATRVRLGMLHPELGVNLSEAEKKSLMGSFRRWADAIVITPTTLILIEASILPDPGKISQLQLYERLLKLTPEYSEYMNRDIRKELVVAIEDPVLIQLAREQNIRVVVFTPDWISDYISTLAGRERQAPKTVL